MRQRCTLNTVRLERCIRLEKKVMVNIRGAALSSFTVVISIGMGGAKLTLSVKFKEQYGGKIKILWIKLCHSK